MDLPPFQTLLDSYSRDVHRFLVANVGRTDADDCYQETWIAALRAYPSLRHATASSVASPRTRRQSRTSSATTIRVSSRT